MLACGRDHEVRRLRGMLHKRIAWQLLAEHNEADLLDNAVKKRKGAFCWPKGSNII